MAEWLARLEGDEHALDLLTEYLEGTNYRVIKEESRYYLRIGDHPDNTEPTVLHETASRSIELLNGAAKLYFGQFRGVTSHVVVRVLEDGVKEGFGFLTLPERSFTLTLPPIPDATLETWMSAGTQDDSVARALTLYGGLDHNWKNLYMVFEVVEEDTGGEQELIKTGWTSRDIKTFKRTANSFRAIGREARHAKSKYKPPSLPMSLKEAQELIREILQKWLKSKSEPP
jgi:hypothetical protein